jgi:RNA polymerase sigma factor (sigma-70 family)
MATESDSIERVLESLAPRLRTLMCRYHISYEDREDLVQEAILVTLPRWEEIENKQGWLLTTIRNLCSVYQRRRKCWSKLVQNTDTSTLQSLAPCIPPPQVQSDYATDLKIILNKTDRKEIFFLYLRYVEELGPTELAAKIGCHPANIRKRAIRTLRHIQINIRPTHSRE